MRLSIAGCAVLFLVGCATAPSPEPVSDTVDSAPPRVILFIGDGAGVPYWTTALLAEDAPAFARLPQVGLVDSRNVEGRITDSAAGATAYATGLLTFNGAIGVGPDSLPRRTIVEAAEARGMATGLVTTVQVTHATPASFAAHVPSRSMTAEIARHLAAADLEVLLGGGRRGFDGTLDGATDLRPGLRERAVLVETPEALVALDPDTVPALVGLLAPDALPWAADRDLTLAEMTRTALDVVGRDPDGFFLMVEAGQSDWRGHDNEPLDAVRAEMVDFDRAIAAALEYQSRHPETLIVVTADHETGGLALEEDSTGALVADYTSDYHTAEMVPLFAGGPGAERFGRVLPIDRVGALLLESIGARPDVAGTATPTAENR